MVAEGVRGWMWIARKCASRLAMPRAHCLQHQVPEGLRCIQLDPVEPIAEEGGEAGAEGLPVLQ